MWNLKRHKQPREKTQEEGTSNGTRVRDGGREVKSRVDQKKKMISRYGFRAVLVGTPRRFGASSGLLSSPRHIKSGTGVGVIIEAHFPCPPSRILQRFRLLLCGAPAHVYLTSSERASAVVNMFVSARVLTPGLEDGPSMVKVLPDPVCPYAKMHTLYLKEEKPKSRVVHTSGQAKETEAGGWR